MHVKYKFTADVHRIFVGQNVATMAYSMVKACRLVSTAMKARGVAKFPSPAPVIANHKKK